MGDSLKQTGIAHLFAFMDRHYQRLWRKVKSCSPQRKVLFRGVCCLQSAALGTRAKTTGVTRGTSTGFFAQSTVTWLSS
jgi:hypothetical protein